MVEHSTVWKDDIRYASNHKRDLHPPPDKHRAIESSDGVDTCSSDAKAPLIGTAESPLGGDCGPDESMLTSLCDLQC
jgi:hypothetical protein